MGKGKKETDWLTESKEYLLNGGLGEVIGMTSVSKKMGFEKVQCDTATMMAICLLADEAVKARAATHTTH